jgi:formylglycine-generating enzyme required for sulfatase activity
MDAWYLPDDPTLGFIEIPAGPFTMGSDPNCDTGSYRDEQPQHTLNPPAFWIGRWPVTVAQFRAFVDDAKFEPGDPGCLQAGSSQPVTSVSWSEALAYCEWLTAKLRESHDMPAPLRIFLGDGKDPSGGVTLPSEAQWEKAARGADGRVYPWGNSPDPNRANYDATGVDAVSVVGCFPGGASPSGVEDLSGNVLEWTRSIEKKYPYRPKDGREDVSKSGAPRVVRGGAFGDIDWVVRAACRHWAPPGVRRRILGFRVVVAPFRF